jgi:hypothetical protein
MPMKISEVIPKVLLRLRPWLISLLLAIAIKYYVKDESYEWSRIDLIWFLVIALIVRLVIHWFVVIRRAYQTIPEEHCAPASQDPTTRIVIFQLRRRAARLRLVARFTLFLILVTLVGGLYTFGWAEQIAAKAQLDRRLSLQREWQEIQEEIKDTQDKLDRAMDPAFKTDIENMLRSLRSRAGYLESLARSSDTSPTSSQSDSTYLVSVVSTKLGSALILLFLVQILVTLYRYNVRFASFCDSRGDVLQLLTTSEHIPLEKVVALLAPDKLDFGKTPSSPVQNALDIAKEIASFRGK